MFQLDDNRILLRGNQPITGNLQALRNWRAQVTAERGQVPEARPVRERVQQQAPVQGQRLEQALVQDSQRRVRAQGRGQDQVLAQALDRVQDPDPG